LLSLFKRAATAAGRAGVVLSDAGVALAVVEPGRSGKPLLRHCLQRHCVAANAQATLQQLFQELRLGRIATSVVLGERAYELVLVEAPDVLPAELKAAIRWRVKDMIDFAIDDAVIDVFEPPAASRRQQRSMYAIAARREAVQRAVDALAPAAPGFDVVDIEELALRNIAALLPEDQKGLALLHLQGDGGKLLLTRGGKLYLSRHIDLSRHLDPDAPAASVDASTLSLEFQRSLDYYESHFDQPPIGDLAILPNGPLAEALALGMTREANLRISMPDLNELFEVETPLDAAMQSACLLAVGAALRLERTKL
jgi:MSHA biogenesis protein MshI